MAEYKFNGLIYRKDYLKPDDYQSLLTYLKGLTPLWEKRYRRPELAPPGDEERALLRPVYWLGNWQFASLNYYHPPQGIHFRCLRAEPFPPIIQRLVKAIEAEVRKNFSPFDIPKEWKLNTLLINYYGHHLNTDGKQTDTARVGEHKDFEPGPVASVSLGSRALFQFIKGIKGNTPIKPALELWLDDNSLQIFGTKKWKVDFFHRVQRVDKKMPASFPFALPQFAVRRINLTFRYVPEEHIYPWEQFPQDIKNDMQGYMEKLAEKSDYYDKLLTKA